MDDALARSSLIEHLQEREVSRLLEIGIRRQLKSGEYLFRLGDDAESLFVVLKGEIDLCFPLSFDGLIKDVRTESMHPGDTLGWSSLVKPYRFTQSARVSKDSEVVGFSRTELTRLFEDSPHSGCAFLGKLCEIIALRLSSLQAVWARGLQRAVSGGHGVNGFFDQAAPPESALGPDR